MTWNGKDATKDGVAERGFDLQVNGNTVPGVYWARAAPQEEQKPESVFCGFSFLAPSLIHIPATANSGLTFCYVPC